MDPLTTSAEEGTSSPMQDAPTSPIREIFSVLIEEELERVVDQYAISVKKHASQVSAETVVGMAASAMWDIYKGLELGRLMDKLLPDVLGKVEVIEGDGGVGTIVKLTFPTGTPGAGYIKEIFKKIDEEKRVRETEMIEGGFKVLGFESYIIRLEIIEKGGESSIIKSSIEYEVDDKLANLASEVTTRPLEIMAEAIGKYLSNQKASA
ncbi:S-norcoclaurine synthase 1-like [Pistacia vera]|uniref:S-norcoclaurine synthase 1-like n=1 Tax=Pistacia vera TaxID=55513 RepID=UPI00126328FE|nr:S-norcoclaurine synthase 1-like [Pistacia vera]